MNSDRLEPGRLLTGEPSWDLARIVAGLRDARHRWRESQNRDLEIGGRELPSREAVRDIVVKLAGALFPMRLGPPDLRQENEDFYVGHTLDAALTALQQQVRLELRHARRVDTTSTTEIELESLRIVRAFAADLPGLRALLDTDIIAAFQGDPAARSVDEVLVCYPGVTAIIHHRLAHRLWTLELPLLARLVAERAHAETGIDIHPGAQIGSSFFIDHGTGVVIGETTVIGQRVRLYQAVTLGAKHFPADGSGALKKGLPRHPIVEDDVVIYAGSTILGRITIGAGTTVGGNVWLTHSVPPGSRITQANTQNQIHAAGDGI